MQASASEASTTAFRLTLRNTLLEPHVRRERRRLVGLSHGRTTLHPEWVESRAVPLARALPVEKGVEALDQGFDIIARR